MKYPVEFPMGSFHGILLGGKLHASTIKVYHCIRNSRMIKVCIVNLFLKFLSILFRYIPSLEWDEADWSCSRTEVKHVEPLAMEPDDVYLLHTLMKDLDST